jgi:tetratricopeptide (TPR) repeat protein
VSHLTTAALAYIRLENHDNALQLYYAAIDKHHDTPEIKPLLDCIYYNIVVINLKRGNTNEAKVAFNKIEATSEYYEKAHLTLADQTTSSDHALSTSEFCEQIRELPY